MSTFHKCFYAFMHLAVRPFLYFNGYRYKKYKPKSKSYLLLCNHNTDIDFFRCGVSLKKQMYFVASEHIFRLGFASKCIKFLVNPIPRRKGASGSETANAIIGRLKEGKNVCMFVEGNRSFNGETGWISPNNARIVRESGVGLITYALHGCYMTTPRWGLEKRKGRSWGAVVNEYTAEDIAKMTDEEITEAIRKDLYVNAFADQEKEMHTYRAKHPAEGLETALFLCPECNSFSSLESHGDTLHCNHCGKDVKFNKYGFFEGGTFKSVLEWDKWQRRFLEDHIGELKDNPDNAFFSDNDIRLASVTPGVVTEPAAPNTLSLYPGKLVCGDKDFPVSEIYKISVVKRDVILFTMKDGGYWQMKSDKPYSAIKYIIAIRFLQGKDYR